MAAADSVCAPQGCFRAMLLVHQQLAESYITVASRFSLCNESAITWRLHLIRLRCFAICIALAARWLLWDGRRGIATLHPSHGELTAATPRNHLGGSTARIATYRRRIGGSYRLIAGFTFAEMDASRPHPSSACCMTGAISFSSIHLRSHSFCFN